LAENKQIHVANQADLDNLRNAWDTAKGGTPQFVRLQSEFGGGRRAVVGELVRGIQADSDDAIIWRVGCLDHENGMQWLIRMYGSFVGRITSDILLRGKVEMILGGQAPKETRRVQQWFQSFTDTIKGTKPDESGQVRLRIPQDNPLLGLVEIVRAISRKVPIVLDLQAPYVVNSVVLAQFIEGLIAETKGGDSKLLVIAHDEPESERTRASFPMALVDVYERNAETIKVQALTPWDAAETQLYLDSKGVEGNAAELARIGEGRPGFIAELSTLLAGRTDLEGKTMADLVPMSVDADELEEPEGEPEEGRKYATAEDAPRVAQLAAILGQAFPASLVADLGGYDRESIDDLLDAMGDTFEEMQFSEELKTWIYKFKSGTYREGVLRGMNNDEGHDLGRRVAFSLERNMAPRAYGYIGRAARIYAAHGAYQRANVMRAQGLTADAPDVWGLSFDLMKYLDEVEWPAAMRRTVNTTLLDAAVAGSNPQAAEQLYNEISEWVTTQDDTALNAWILFTGSKLDARRQDLFRARERANDAMKLYEGLDAKQKVAEIYAHLAAIELQDGNLNAAMEACNNALNASKVTNEEGQDGFAPQILAQVDFVRGVVARRSNNLDKAKEHFQRANEIAAQVGLGPIALDAGLNLGEALLASRDAQNARGVLARVAQLAQQTRQPQRERAAAELLAQAEGASQNFDAALKAATRVLQLDQAMKFNQALPIDLYWVGFFTFMQKKPSEALTFFKQASDRAAALGNHPIVKELHFFTGEAAMQSGNGQQALTSFTAALPLIRAAKDTAKLMATLERLSVLAEQGGDKAQARTLLTEAIEVARGANQKDARKAFQKRLTNLEG